MDLDPYGSAVTKRLALILSLLVCGLCHPLAAIAGVEVVAHWRLGEEVEAGKLPKRIKSTVGDASLVPAGTVPTDEGSPDARGSSASLKFDGKSSCLKGKAPLDASDNFGAEAFVRADSNDGFHVILQQGSSAHGWSLVRNGKGYQVVLGGVQVVGWSGDIEQGRWCHIAIIRVGGVTKFFVNGQEAGQSQAKINPAGKTATIAIGAAANGTQDFFAGSIDEVRIFKLVGGGFDPADLLINQPDVAKDPAVTANKAATTKPDDGIAASIRFDQTPVESGITFRKEHMAPTNIAGRDGWVAGPGSAAAVPYARSVLLTVTDPRFRKGQMPVCDVEVDFLQTFNSPVELKADTERGSPTIGGSWGNAPVWKTFRVSLDDAVFGARPHSSKQTDMNTDGFDLRLNSFGGDFVIGGVRLIGYDMDKDPDYRRLLRLESITSPNTIFAFEPGQSHTLTYKFRNLARKALSGRYDIEFKKRNGELVSRVTKELVFAGRQRVEVPFTLDAATLPKGVYDLSITVHQTDKPAAPVVLSYEGYIAITDTQPLPKAKPGEFLYGLDVKQGPSYDEEKLLKWTELMGTDIIRHGFGGEDDVNAIAANLPKFAHRGLSVMLICDPPKETDPAARESKLPAKLAFLEGVGKKLPQIRYFELGNEPDLKFFYPGEMKDYAADLARMSAAVKKGNPAAFVMNGGLSYAGAEAMERCKEFVKAMDAAAVDGWAYHGHGVGMAAEQQAWERMHAVAEAAGKADKLLVETESGMAARTRSQEETQARTVIQKMVYAQSKKMPLFMWFRLLMFEEDYGSLRNEKEPRPAILAYRSMVRSLRGLKFDREISGLPAGLHGFTFRDAKAARVCVLWSDSAQPRNLVLRLPDMGKAVTLRDLNGNDHDLTVRGDSVKVAVAVDPVFVVAKSTPADSQFSLLPPLLDAPASPVLFRGLDGSVSVSVTNALATPMSATLQVTTPPNSTIAASKTSFPITLPPGGKTEVAVPVHVNPDPAGVRWPSQWTVFPGAPLPPDPASLTAIPDSLPGDGKSVTGVKLAPDNFRIDFEKAGGVMGDKHPGLAMATVESDSDQTVRIGASADWWMAWFANGKKVYDTLEAGNGAGFAITDHVFNLPLKKGKNLLVVQVLSGSQGWKLLIGDPVSIAKAQGTSVDHLDLALVGDNGDPFDRQQVEPQLRLPLAALTFPFPGTPADWETLDPDTVLGESAIHNDFAKQPDSSRWWKGASDLSARVWLRAEKDATAGQPNQDRLLLVVAVEDDALQSGPKGDRIKIVLDDATEVVLTATQAVRVGNITWYFANPPRRGTTPTGTLNLTVIDVDVPGVDKQTATLPPHPFAWPKPR